MVEILGVYLPVSISFLAGQFISMIIAFAAVVFSDSFIGHNIEMKRAFILSFISFFAVPVLIPFTGITFPYINVYAPLITWIILGETILDNDLVTKLKVLGVAFFIYYVLNIVVTQYALSYLRF